MEFRPYNIYEVMDCNSRSVWNLFTCYGPPYNSIKKEFWESLEQIINKNGKWGGRDMWRMKLFLKHFLTNVGDMDLGFVESRFTWENNQEGLGRIMERLDREIADEEWIQLFPQAEVIHLAMENSDHCSFLLQSEKPKPFSRRPFQFFKTWVLDPSSF